MFKKICFFSFLVFSSLTYAEICPTVESIQNNSFAGWQALNIDSGTAAQPSQLENFKSHVRHFSLAEWMKDAPEGSSHCYYQGEDTDTRFLGIFLARNNLMPGQGSWKKMSDGIYQCKADIYDCLFHYS